MKNFRAPWGRALVGTSVLSLVICVGVGVWGLLEPVPSTVRLFVHPVIPGLLLAIVLGTALFIIRGYTVTPEAILVHRLFWDTRLARAGLVSAKSEPNAMRGSLRFGNGGMFSFTGWFWNKTLGRYEAYVTDLKRTVVLRWDKRTAVVSPDDPEGFVREVLG